jgi:hypothetical protein
VHATIDVDSPAAQIARLENELQIAVARAVVAEEQLHRVHIAVRAFKEKQLQARAATAQQLAAAKTAEVVESARTDLYGSWAVADPSLDARLDEYLGSDFEPDRSRDWMLSE